MTAPPRDDERRARFRALYEENYERILGYALRRVPHADALDVVAETFTVAWRRLARVPDGDEARLWLYGTARRVLANHERGARRRARLHGRLAQEPQTVAASDPSQGVAAAAFARLRPADREVLALVAWEGLDARQLARVIGCSPNAARIRVHRARKRLAEELDRDGDSVKHRRPAGHVAATAIQTKETG
jgi:RNA polymerase sigma-70 factor (ECF subfamily)